MMRRIGAAVETGRGNGLAATVAVRRLPALVLSPAVYLLVIPLAVAIGAVVVVSPAAGFGLVVALGVGAAAIRVSRLGAVELLLGALPWLVIFDGVLPPVLRTFVTTAAAFAMLALAAPLRYRDATIPVAALLFAIVVLANAIFATDSEELIQACKYLIFPAAVLAVTSEGGRERLPYARDFVLGSCLLALLVHLGVIAAGLGQTGTKYDIGEQLGFGREVVHEMALTFVVVAAAGLVSAKKLPYQVAFFTLGAVPALLTGVRSALLALVVVVLIFLLRSHFNRRSLAIVGSIVALAAVSGGAAVVQERIAQQEETEHSFSEAGSNRGAIWTVAVTPWWNAGPSEWTFGLGLGAIEAAALRNLGENFAGHSDLIEIGVTLGLVGLLAWGLLWVALLRAKLELIVLVPLIVYALVNGSMIYVAPLTLGLAFAAACRPPPSASEPVG
jgi:O-antigen ligase/polysaccharide polymerase Wzy-like membrane protein